MDSLLRSCRCQGRLGLHALLRSLPTERIAVDDPGHDRAERVVCRGCAFHYLPDLRHVEVFDLAIEGVHHQALGERGRELVLMAGQVLAQIGRAAELQAAGQHGAGVNRRACCVVPVAPAALVVEVLQREAGRVDQSMATLAGRILAVQFKARADRGDFFAVLHGNIRVHVRRWWSRGRAHDALQNPGTAQHG
jgi:hypothetical protein